MADMQFWPRLEIAPPFVLSELRHILHVGLCQVEMSLEAVFRGLRSAAREAKPRSGRA